ncbi:hypothetical protein GB931_03950 [Modestobacter sp. I12A-02628]|uniref:Uncharacterized protein n=1 Tax=Goekera deserti TaxID=2497753 RepID=A0A7K3WIT3_9ACTN|nr:hypothetical protein [Goekera deserti]MPQ97092.1 hypothetical protein [Goekera deserti]NDI46591.1 hypothetical protein [Goekera deserti]NEL56347.1 hypothetical protein [Goekera deserti]
MQVTPIDERDSSWEDHRPRFRVYVFGGGGEPGGSWAVDTFDVEDADVLEVTDWAEGQAGPDDLVAVALIGELDPQADTETARRGLVWLLGTDPNGTPSDATVQRLLDGMLARRESRRAAGDR